MAIPPIENIGNIHKITPQEWEEAKKLQKQYKYLVLTSNGDIIFCKKKEDIGQVNSGMLRSVKEINEMIAERFQSVPQTDSAPIIPLSGRVQRRLPPQPPPPKTVEKIKEPLPISDEPPFLVNENKIEGIMKEAVHLAQSKRRDYTNSAIESLKDEFKSIDEKFLTYRCAVKQQEAKEEFEAARKDFNKAIEQLIVKYPDAYCLYALILPHAVIAVSTYGFHKERAISTLTCKMRYIEQAEKDIQDNISVICQTFFSDVEESHLIRFTTTVCSKAETHNQGKSTVFVHFTLHGRSLGKLVYKPRSALLDQMVMSLFHEINSLPNDKKPLSVSLGTCVILPLHENASIWQYVEGDLASNYAKTPYDTVVECLQRIPKISKEKKNKLLSQLDKLDTVLTKMKIGDLHPENVFIRGLETDNPEIVIIDLENRQLGTQTFLGARTDVLIGFEEDEYISNFNNKAEKISCRFIPMASQELAMVLQSIKQARQISASICVQLLQDGFQLIMTKEELLKYIFLDVLHNDIPYFTELGGVLYFGTVDSNILIAKRENQGG